MHSSWSLSQEDVVMGFSQERELWICEVIFSKEWLSELRIWEGPGSTILRMPCIVVLVRMSLVSHQYYFVPIPISCSNFPFQYPNATWAMWSDHPLYYSFFLWIPTFIVWRNECFHIETRENPFWFLHTRYSKCDSMLKENKNDMLLIISYNYS